MDHILSQSVIKSSYEFNLSLAELKGILYSQTISLACPPTPISLKKAFSSLTHPGQSPPDTGIIEGRCYALYKLTTIAIVSYSYSHIYQTKSSLKEQSEIALVLHDE